MNTKTDEGLYEKARKLFISKASIDEFAGWATPRQVDAVHRLLDTELANRERAKHDRLLRRARFPVVKGLDGYDFTNVRLPDGYMLDELLGLGFIPRAQDLVFYGKTGRGKTHLAIGLGMKAIDMGLGVRFHQTAELVLQLGKAKRDGTLETMLRDIGRADLIILDEFGYVPFDIDGARLLYQIIAGSYERRSIVFTTNIEFSKWGTVFADDKLAAAIIDRIVHHGRLLEFADAFPSVLDGQGDVVLVPGAAQERHVGAVGQFAPFVLASRPLVVAQRGRVVRVPAEPLGLLGFGALVDGLADRGGAQRVRLYFVKSVFRV